MGYVISLICAICFIFAWRRERKLYGPVCIMAGMWFLISLLASVRLYGLFKSSNLAFILIGIGIVAFSVGGRVASRYGFSVGQYHLGAAKEKCVNYQILRILCVVSVIMLIYPDIMSLQKLLVQGVGFAGIRSDNEIVYPNVLLQLIYNYVVLPFSFAISPILGAMVYNEKRNDKIVLFSGIFIIASRLITEAGRAIVLYTLLSFFLANTLTKGKKGPQKMHIGVVFLVIVGISLVLQVTFQRTGDSIVHHFLIYITGGVPHLSIRLDELNGEMTYGVASFFGLFNFVFTMLENVGLGYPNFMVEANEIVTHVVRTTRTIDTFNTQFNAFVTPFYYMYVDGRELGVFLIMFLYGFMCQKSYYKAVTKMNSINLSVYLLLSQGLVFSFVRMQFAVVHYALAFFYIMLIGRHVLGKEEK